MTESQCEQKRLVLFYRDALGGEQLQTPAHPEVN